MRSTLRKDCDMYYLETCLTEDELNKVGSWVLNLIKKPDLDIVEYMKSLEGTFDLDVDSLIPQIEAIINMALGQGESLSHTEFNIYTTMEQVERILNELKVNYKGYIDHIIVEYNDISKQFFVEKLAPLGFILAKDKKDKEELFYIYDEEDYSLRDSSEPFYKIVRGD